MTSHCTSLSANWKWPVIAGSATLTAMSSGASEAPSPTMARPMRGRDVIPRPKAEGPLGPQERSLAALGMTPSEMLTEERHHAFPRRLGRGRVVGRALLVGEGVLGVVAEDLGLGAARRHLLLERVHHLGRAPVVLV